MLGGRSRTRLGFQGYTSFWNLRQKQDDEGIFYNNVGGSEALQYTVLEAPER